MGDLYGDSLSMPAGGLSEGPAGGFWLISLLLPPGGLCEAFCERSELLIDFLLRGHQQITPLHNPMALFGVPSDSEGAVLMVVLLHSSYFRRTFHCGIVDFLPQWHCFELILKDDAAVVG